MRANVWREELFLMMINRRREPTDRLTDGPAVIRCLSLSPTASPVFRVVFHFVDARVTTDTNR